MAFGKGSKAMTPYVLLGVLTTLILPYMALAAEEPKFTVEKKGSRYEIRTYPDVLVAEMEIDGDFENAGNAGFRILADYIFGNNQAKEKIDMTAPVAQVKSEKIAMTAPVSMSASGQGFVIQFTMPAKYTLNTLPSPNNPLVRLRLIPARRVAVHAYSGDWSRGNYEKHLEIFRSALTQDGLAAIGEPVFARFNPPFWPWFLRRNEIWIELGK
jgi:hypothetical protein